MQRCIPPRVSLSRCDGDQAFRIPPLGVEPYLFMRMCFWLSPIPKALWVFSFLFKFSFLLLFKLNLIFAIFSNPLLIAPNNYIMVQTDIKIFSVLKRELEEWFNLMDSSNQIYVQERLGLLLYLLELGFQGSVIQATAHFLNPATSIFVFNGFEMVPTVKEYEVAVGLHSSKRLVEPPIGKNPSSILAEFLEILRLGIDSILAIFNKKCLLSFLIDRFATPFDERSRHAARVFIFMFLGTVIFPTFKKIIDPLLSFIVRQVCLG